MVKGIEPEPEWGIIDLVPGRRLDLSWRLALFGLEYDGHDHHVLPTDRDADGVRDLESLVSGIAILRVTAGMIREQPERTRALIEAILRRRLGEMAALRDAGLLHLPPPRTPAGPAGMVDGDGGTEAEARCCRGDRRPGCDCRVRRDQLD